jgi:hypothetical protein
MRTRDRIARLERDVERLKAEAALAKVLLYRLAARLERSAPPGAGDLLAEDTDAAWRLLSGLAWEQAEKKIFTLTEEKKK